MNYVFAKTMVRHCLFLNARDSTFSVQQSPGLIPTGKQKNCTCGMLAKHIRPHFPCPILICKKISEEIHGQ